VDITGVNDRPGRTGPQHDLVWVGRRLRTGDRCLVPRLGAGGLGRGGGAGGIVPGLLHLLVAGGGAGEPTDRGEADGTDQGSEGGDAEAKPGSDT
jgi:hypothetical protein